MEKVFRPYFLVYKNEIGVCMEFFDSLGDLYKFLLSKEDVIGYSVFRTLEMYTL